MEVITTTLLTLFRRHSAQHQSFPMAETRELHRPSNSLSRPGPTPLGERRKVQREFDQLVSIWWVGGCRCFTDCHLDLGKGRHWDLNRSTEQLGRRSEVRQGRRPRHSGDTEPTLVKVETELFSSEL